MKTKFIDLTDTGTFIPILLLEFEETDSTFLKKIGWGTGLRIVLNFATKRVTCISGQSFKDSFGETIENLSQKMESNGTIISFKESLNYISDIRQLPDDFNVEAFRKYRNLVYNRKFVDREIRDILDDYGTDYCISYLRKHKYTESFSEYIHIAIFDIKTNELLSDIGRSSKYHFDILAEYMWIPLSIADGMEIKCFENIKKLV